jgi:hypothetical protein
MFKLRKNNNNLNKVDFYKKFKIILQIDYWLILSLKSSLLSVVFWKLNLGISSQA